MCQKTVAVVVDRSTLWGRPALSLTHSSTPPHRTTQTPHGSAAQDVAIYAKLLGMSPVEALRCATGVGARFMGLAVGHLHAGFAGDVIVVAGDPTVDPTAVQGDNVRVVVACGRVVMLRASDGIRFERRALPFMSAALQPWDLPTLSTPAAPHLRGEGLLRSDESSRADVVRTALRTEFRRRYPAADEAAAEVALGMRVSERCQ